MKRRSVIRTATRSLSPIMLATLAAVYFARKWPEHKRNLQFALAFRAGRKFYAAYPHIAKDIAYGDQPWQTLDVYWPPQGERLPVMLFVHGGSWSWGDKNLYPLVGARYTAQGLVVVVINYAHYPQVRFPAFVEDAAAAVAWTVHNVAQYRGDPNRIVVGGHSSGAHILSLVALDDRYLAQHDLKRDVIRGLVAISAPTDLGQLVVHLRANAAASADGLIDIMGGPDNLPLADPIRHARADAPPFLIAHGVDDELVPIQVARHFAAALQSAGARVELREYERTDHFSIVLSAVRQNTTPLITDTADFTRRITDAGTLSNGFTQAS